MTDRSLLRRFRAGQQDAATALYVRYASRLQRLADNQTGPEIAVRVDPEGIVQSVFRTFFRRAAEGQYEVADGDELWKLFLVIALNKIRRAAAFHRAAKRDVGRTRALSEPAIISAGKLNEADAQAVLKMTMDEIIQALPAGQGDIVMLRIEGRSVQEISEITGRAKRSVERILQNFRKQLGQIISEG